MARYRVNKVKPVSNARRYEVLRSDGVLVPTGIGGQTDIIKGQALDDYLDEKIWRAAHPGQEPIKEWDDGVPPQ